MKIAIFNQSANEIEACISIPYKGYEVSLTTVGRYPEVCVFASRESAEALYTEMAFDGDSLKAAFTFVDGLVK